MANEQNLKPFNKGFDVRRGKKPKGSKHVSTYIRELLEDIEIDYTYNGKNVRGTPIEAIIKATIIKAIQGDLKAAEILIKNGYAPIKEEAVQEKIVVVTRAHSYRNHPREDGERAV
jgi:hypothetical protein